MADALDYHCRACDQGVSAAPFTAQEMLLETRESFEYMECPACGSIQIRDVPADLERYYPETYRHAAKKLSWLDRVLRSQRGAFVRGARWNLVGGAALAVSRPEWVEWMTRTGARADSRLLDVGYGDGALLNALSASGYRNLTGIDPFVAPIEQPAPGVRVYRRGLDDEPGTYDIVMLHHSLEHITDPAQALGEVRRLLDPNGWAIIRMPVAGSYGWRTYREHWLGLEPPRHLVIPSIDGMRRLADRAGFTVESIAFDSSGCCYAVSEIWASGRSVPYPRRPWQKRTIEMCGAERVAEFHRLAAQRNTAGDGDHAAYYLRVRG